MDQLHYTIQNDAWTNILLVNELLELGLVYFQAEKHLLHMTHFIVINHCCKLFLQLKELLFLASGGQGEWS
mgnify:CR=1 FL=1